jgi:hypothetical protein
VKETVEPINFPDLDAEDEGETGADGEKRKRKRNRKKKGDEKSATDIMNAFILKKFGHN